MPAAAVLWPAQRLSHCYSALLRGCTVVSTPPLVIGALQTGCCCAKLLVVPQKHLACQGGSRDGGVVRKVAIVGGTHQLAATGSSLRGATCTGCIGVAAQFDGDMRAFASRLHRARSLRVATVWGRLPQATGTGLGGEVLHVTQ